MIVTLGALLFLLQSPSAEAIQHAQAGAAAEQEGRFDAAIGEFNKEIELAPGLASGYASLGSVYFRKGDYSSAIPLLQHALKIDGEMNGTHQLLGVALLLQGDAAGALPHLERVPVPELLGLAYLETGRVGPALTSFQAALRRRPEDPDLLYYFGHTAALASQKAEERLSNISPGPDGSSEAPLPPQKEIPDLDPIEKDLMEKPDDPERLRRFARMTAAASKKSLDLLLETHAGSARAHQIAAERYTSGGRVGDAEKEYVESIRLQPYAAGVHMDFGKLLLAARDFAHALPEFRAECQLRPADALAFYYAGTTLMQLGQPKDALEMLARANQLAPGAPAILLQLSKAAAATGDKSLADKLQNQATHPAPAGEAGVAAGKPLNH